MMAITDELRGWFDRYTMRKDVYDELLAIADRIDAEHERLMQEQPFTVDMVPMTDERMAEHGWVRLPKDADGEYIHEHDKVDWRDHAGTWHENKTVVAVCNDGCYVLDGIVFHVHESDIRHHKRPTVEDVLLDLHRKLSDVSELYDVDSDELEEEYTRVIEEFAAKLLLAGGDE